MKINSELGYKPVPFSELTTDPSFGKDAKPVNYEILKSKENKMCLCTGMLLIKVKLKVPPNIHLMSDMEPIKKNKPFLED
jgi:hypothetical protein